jgi:glycosyltransferase involved in cell wall biosynthesis
MSAVERSAVDFFLPVSHATAAGNGLLGGEQYDIIPNFMPNEIGAAHDVETYLAQLPKVPFLLFVGDLRQEKGIDVLLSAYVGLANPPPLVLIGKVWAESPTVLPPNVILLKNWPNEAVLAAWSRCLMALVPSIWPEPFGIVAIEAMASGRPVIASRIGGLADIVSDGQTGYLVQPGDALALQAAIERLLSDETLRKEMGQAAQRQAAAFQAAVVVPRIERLYAELLQPPFETLEPSHVGKHYYQQS